MQGVWLLYKKNVQKMKHEVGSFVSNLKLLQIVPKKTRHEQGV